MEVNLTPIKHSDEMEALAKILSIASWRTMKQRMHRSFAQISEPQILSDNKYVVLEATDFYGA